MNKSGEIADMMRGMMANDDLVVKEIRCLYENDEVLVMHSIVVFPMVPARRLFSFLNLRTEKLSRQRQGQLS